MTKVAAQIVSQIGTLAGVVLASLSDRIGRSETLMPGVLTDMGIAGIVLATICGTTLIFISALEARAAVERSKASLRIFQDQAAENQRRSEAALEAMRTSIEKMLLEARGNTPSGLETKSSLQALEALNTKLTGQNPNAVADLIGAETATKRPEAIGIGIGGAHSLLDQLGIRVCTNASNRQFNDVVAANASKFTEAAAALAELSARNAPPTQSFWANFFKGLVVPPIRPQARTA